MNADTTKQPDTIGLIRGLRVTPLSLERWVKRFREPRLESTSARLTQPATPHKPKGDRPPEPSPATLWGFTPGRPAAQAAALSRHCERSTDMNTITTKDGTEIYYKDWGEGPVVTFSHGWPLSSDAWDGQMLFLAQNGFRAVAHDRRGHGRSSQASSGNDMDGYADDLAAVIEALDLRDATLVGHSTGGGEVARYIGRHGTGRVAKAALISAVPPLMLKTEANPEGRRSRSSTACARAWSRTGRSSTRISRSSSTARTGRAPRSPRACWTSSGCGACSPA